MLVDEMLEKNYPSGANNFNEALERIKQAMRNGEKYVYLPKEECKKEFSWWATYETISKLREEGFDINKVWEPWEYWSVEWYDKVN